MLTRPDDVEGKGKLTGMFADRSENIVRQVDRGQHAAGIAGVNSRLFDMLHNPGNDNIGPVAERVDIALGRILEEVVDQDGAAPASIRSLCSCT